MYLEVTSNNITCDRIKVMNSTEWNEVRECLDQKYFPFRPACLQWAHAVENKNISVTIKLQSSIHVVFWEKSYNMCQP